MPNKAKISFADNTHIPKVNDYNLFLQILLSLFFAATFSKLNRVLNSRAMKKAKQ